MLNPQICLCKYLCTCIFYRVLSSKLTRISLAAKVESTEPSTPTTLPVLSVTVGMQGEKGGRERASICMALHVHVLHVPDVTCILILLSQECLSMTLLVGRS